MNAFIRGKYKEHKQRAKRKGIPFDLPYEWYYEQMAQNDNWKNYGVGPGHLVWSRTCDLGGYWPGWCQLVPWEENQKARNNNIKNHKSKFKSHSLVLLKKGHGGPKGWPPLILLNGTQYEGYEEPAKIIGCHPRSLKNYLLGRTKSSSSDEGQCQDP